MQAFHARPDHGRTALAASRLTPLLVGTAALGLAAALLTAPGAARAQAVCAATDPTVQAGSATGAGALACGAATASGVSATGVGQTSTASGLQSTAVGFTTLADGPMSTALGGRSKADAQFSTAVGWANTASGVNSFAGGNKSVASGSSSVALGDQAQATAANAVALGSGSVAGEANTVSVGSATNQRRITNVAAGIAPGDVATFGQLQASLGAVDGQIRQVTRRADAGTAAAMAVAGLPQAFTPGKGLVGLAVGTWRSEAAFALGASKALDDGRTVFKAGAAFDSRGTGGVNAGVGWQF